MQSLAIEDVLQIPIVRKVADLAEKLNIETYIVGGFVRDIFLERESKDLDIVVLGKGIEFAHALSGELGEGVRTAYFKNFGTAQVKYEDWILEFVGARKESYNRGSRNPMVEDGTLDDDQKRRDFTINAMYISLNKDTLGEVIDPFGGMEHMEQKLIQTPLDPKITFDDDPLRMLRAIRFAARFGFRLSDEVKQAITDYSDRIKIISAERIIEEINGMIMADKPSLAFKLMEMTGLLKIIFPELVRLKGVEVRNGQGHKDNFYHTLQVLDNICPNTDNLWLRWSAIMHDIAKPPTKRFEEGHGWTFHGHEDLGSRWVKKIFRRLRLPLDEKMKYVESLVRLHLRPIALTKETVTDSAVRRLIVDAGDHLDDLLTLCRADITSKNEAKVKRFLANLDTVAEKVADVIERDNLRNWQPVVNGTHIMERYQIKNPREIGILKDAARSAILDGEVPNVLEPALLFLDKLAANENIKRKID
ncbi:CCA tRNA nucleotidyltransferase [Bacteroidia bacterium]|jgi:poly(A) polymerase|nr:CCA tRNA nucleotidyltransferase [Bacteroidia bacterium]